MEHGGTFLKKIKQIYGAIIQEKIYNLNAANMCILIF
jgi:hypothetical protein